MKHISAGKNTLEMGLSELVDYGAFCYGAYGNTRNLGQLVFGNKSHRKKQCIAFVKLLASLNGFKVAAHLCNGHTLHPVFAVYLSNGVAEHKGNVVGDQAFVHILFCAV